MTAQVGVLNKIAVALASDSAVTFTCRTNSGERYKVYNSANKLFQLSDQHPVGIMTFGQANFFCIPLSSIIELYRIKLGTRKFNTLKEYADDFKDFITTGYTPPSLEQQTEFMQNNIDSWLESLVEDMMDADIDRIVVRKRKGAKTFVSNFIHEAWERILEYPFLEISTNEQRELFWSEYSYRIKDSVGYYFEEFPLEQESVQKLYEIIMGMIFRQVVSPENVTGIVIAGFGEEELYPSLYRFGISGLGDNKIKAIENEPIVISDEHDSAVVPFAQDEMVYLFIEGIDYNLQERTLNVIAKSIEKRFLELANRFCGEDEDTRKILFKELEGFMKNILDDYLQSMENYKQRMHIMPILRMIRSFPENELALMAEKLVDLTAFKRRISIDPGTVGGDIDVALITKSGFKWFAGKHCS